MDNKYNLIVNVNYMPNIQSPESLNESFTWVFNYPPKLSDSLSVGLIRGSKDKQNISTVFMHPDLKFGIIEE
jgi:hypothetical protein